MPAAGQNGKAATDEFPDTLVQGGTLGEVKVKAYRKIVKGEGNKMVLGIREEAFLKTAKTDVVLRSLPMIQETDQGYCLQGQTQSAKLLIDGIEATLEEVRKLSASEIKQVEIKDTGSNGETTSGEINIIRKKSLHPKLRASIDASAGLIHKSFSIFPDISFRNDRLDFRVFSSNSTAQQCNRTWLYRDDVEQQYIDSKSYKHYQGTHYAKLTVQLSERLLTSVSGGVFGMNSKADRYWRYLGTDQPQQKDDERLKNANINSVTQYSISRSKRVFLKGRFLYYMNSLAVSPEAYDFRSHMREWSAQAGFENDSVNIFRGRNHEVEGGYKFIFRKNILSSADYYCVVHQPYIGISIPFSQRLTLYTTLKADYYRYRFGDDRIGHFSLLPRLNFVYRPGKWNMGLSYERRIIRPSIDYLNPETYYVNENNKMKGNTSLTHQYDDGFLFRAGRQFGNSFVNFTTSYDIISDMIAPVYMEDANTTTYENAGKGREWRSTLLWNKPFFGNKMTLNLTVGADYADYSLAPQLAGTALNTDNHGWNFRTMCNLTYTTSKGWFFNLFGNYSRVTRTLTTNVYRNPMVNFIMSKSFFSNHLEVSLSCNDIFGSYKRSRIYYTLSDVRQMSRNSIPNIQNISLSVSLHFGKMFGTRRTMNSIVNDDIKTKGQ